MIKLLRRIRQNLLTENKVKSYLLYAVGEIILVVIGILIALSLSNWNTSYQSAIEELELLTEMKQNLESDLEDCHWNINRNEELHASNQAVLLHLENQTPFSDTLSTHYGNLLGTTTQLRNMAAYDHFKSRGMNLIRNDILRQWITVLYSARYYYIEMKELQYDNQIQLHHFIPQLNGKVIIDSKTKKGRPVDLKSLYVDDYFKGALRTNMDVKAFMVFRYTNLSRDIEKLIRMIDQELSLRANG